MTTVRSLGPRTLGATLAEGLASFEGARKAFGIPPINWSAPKHFTFRRRRTAGVWGWEVGLQVGRMWANLSGVAPFLRRLPEAHAWAVGFAATHGFKPMVLPRQRKKPRPKLTLVPAPTHPEDRLWL